MSSPRSRLAVALVAGLAGFVPPLAGTATAQSPPTTTPPPPPVYTATPPTNKPLYQDGQTGRYLLAGEWLYRADPTDIGDTQGWWRDVADTTGWSPVTVPNSFNAGVFTNDSNAGSVGWYRRDFTVPSGAFGRWVPKRFQHWIVRFESVNYNATVWLNGRELGTHSTAYLPFEFDLSNLHPGVNRLIVRVDSVRDGGDLPPGPADQWWDFGGLQREVYLRAAARADLQQVIVRPTLPCATCKATIEEQALVRNVTSVSQTVQLSGIYGHQRLDFGEHTIPPGKTWTATANTVVAHPRLWAPGSPTLYKATLTLADANGKRLGGYFTDSGIRSIKVTANGLLQLNGRQLHLRGVNLHEQNILTGAALSPAQIDQLVGWARQLGATVIRAHYPLNPEIEELADRYGILLWSEVPVYQTANTYLSRPAWLGHARAVLRSNIVTNENHPSVLVWSIGNELPPTVTNAERSYIAGAAALAHQLDPTRPVGMAIDSWPGLKCQADAYAPLDVVGVNDYIGWFDAGGGTTDDRDILGPHLDELRACMPHQALMITEFGYDANRDGPVEERGTYAFQTNSIEYQLGVFAQKPWLAAAIYFVLQDYVAYPGYNGGNPEPDPPFNQKGLVDFQGNLKPAFAVVQSLLHATVQISAAKRKPARR
jgi:beta-glucuronidase